MDFILTPADDDSEAVVRPFIDYGDDSEAYDE